MMSGNYDSIAEDPLYNFQNNDQLFSGGFNNDSNCGLLVPLDNAENMTLFENSNSSNPNMNELVDILSNNNSDSSSHNNLMDLSLDDIPLTEQAVESANILQLVPDDIPEDNILLVKVPECLQNDPLLNEILNIQLDQSVLNTIDASIQGNDGVLLTKPSEQQEMSVERRQPLQLIQQVIKFTAAKKVHSMENEKKKLSKRKQHFHFPREDLVEFYSDDDDADKKDNKPPSPKRPKITEREAVEKPITIEVQSIEEPVIIDDLLVEITNIEKPKSNNKRQSVIEKCPRCEKGFRRLMMHKCKEIVKASPIKNVINKLKPSDVPTLQCSVCKEFFGNQKALDNHFNQKHSHLICKICKSVLKNTKLLKIHIAKCGIDIQPVQQKRSLRSVKKI